MKKLQRLVFSGLLVLTLAFGLAGCGSNHDSSKSSTSKDKVTKVVKKSSNKDKSSHKKSSQSESDENSNSANSNATTNDSESSTSSSSQSSSSQKQLGLNDVAVWTDENGITYVDSDGMDRQTSPNQSGVTYKDWSGSLPSNAQIVKQN